MHENPCNRWVKHEGGESSSPVTHPKVIGPGVDPPGPITFWDEWAGTREEACFELRPPGFTYPARGALTGPHSVPGVVAATRSNYDAATNPLVRAGFRFSSALCGVR